MKAKEFLFIAIATYAIQTGCHFNSTYINRDRDRQDGEKAVAAFYELMKDENYQRTYKLFDKKFFVVTDTQKLKQIFEFSRDKLGKIERYAIENWKTQAIVGTDAKTDYLFVCIVKRSGFTSRETITLEKEKDTVKILGYNVDSEGFFNKNRRKTKMIQ